MSTFQCNMLDEMDNNKKCSLDTPNSFQKENTVSLSLSVLGLGFFLFVAALSLMASIATMTARLASKILLKDGDETVDLRDLSGRGKSFVSPNFFMVAPLNTYKSFIKDSFRGAFRIMWRLDGTIEVQEWENDRYLFPFTSEHDIVQVKKGGLCGFQQAIVVRNDNDGLSPIQDVSLIFVWIWV